MRRFASVILLVGVVWLAVSPAVAQEYAAETGDLEFTSATVLTFSGDGYAADSTVLLTLTLESSDEAIDLGALEVDADGVLSGSVTLPDGLSPGTYTLAATGVTEDGATRVLSAEVTVLGEETVESTTTTVAETTTTTSATTTSGAETTTTLAPKPPPEPAEDSTLLMLILWGVAVFEFAAIGFLLWYFRESWTLGWRRGG